MNIVKELKQKLLAGLQKATVIGDSKINDAKTYNRSVYLKFIKELEEENFSPRAIEMAKAFIFKQQQASTDYFTRVIQQSTGVDLSAQLKTNSHLFKQIEDYTEWNVNLIQSIRQDLLGEVKKQVMNAVLSGSLNKDLAKVIQERTGVSESRAKFIARDQSSKLNSAITKANQEACGITHYRWCTGKDERVRESHAELEGQIFAWDSPPPVGHPGEDFNCRCIAIPILKEVTKEDIEQAKMYSAQNSTEQLIRKEIGATTYNRVVNHISRADIQDIMKAYNLTRTDALVISAYTDSYHKGLNRALRNETTTTEQKEFTKKLDKALSKMAIYDDVTYRYVKLSADDIKRYSVGSIVEEFQFTSTSKDSAETSFTGNVKFIIYGKTGRDIEKISLYPHEKEVLFQTKKKFFVKDVYKSNSSYLIELVEVE